jgi:hypothetical protein
MDNEGPKNEGPKNEGPKNEALNKEFLGSLNEKERMAYNIAKSHLGTMFSLDKCNAFLEWVNERNNKN